METAVKISSKKITTLLILSFVLLLITPSLGIILIGGSIPTLIAYILDKGRRRSLTVCVGMMNFAGLLPILIYFYEYYPIWGAVIADIYSLKNWGVIYIAAFIGFCFYWVLPGAVVKFYIFFLLQKIKMIEKRKIKLESRYGREDLKR